MLYNKHDVCRVAASPANTNNKNEYSCPALTLPWRGYCGYFPDVGSSQCPAEGLAVGAVQWVAWYVLDKLADGNS